MRHGDADAAQPIADVRHGRRRLVAIDRDAHQLGAGLRQRRDLADGAVDVGRVRVGHRLDDDGLAAADHDAADIHRDGRGGGQPGRLQGGCRRNSLGDVHAVGLVGRLVSKS